MDKTVNVPSRGWRRLPLVRLLGSVWFGIALLAIMVVYASIGSGLAPVRGALEMSEMQVFEHWLFCTLMALFCASLIVSTLTRVRLRWLSAGVWITHAGLLTLIGGSAWYFANKVEGDLMLISPRIELYAAQGNRPLDVDFVAAEGARWVREVPALGGDVSFEVVELKPQGNDPVGSAVVEARFGDAPPQRVTLVANAEDPTPVGGLLALRLRTFSSESHFYDSAQPALYFGPAGQVARRFVPLEHLPLHRERYLPGEGVLRDTTGRSVPSKRTWPHLALGSFSIPTGWFEPWRLPIEVDLPEDFPFRATVTGYVPYVAGMETIAAGDGDRENPIVSLRLASGTVARQFGLAALEPRNAWALLQGFPVPFEFRWVQTAREREAALQPLAGPDELTIEVKDPPVRQTLAVTAGQEIQVPGTSYVLQVETLMPSWPLVTPGFEGARSPVALVAVNTGERNYRRTVIERFPQLSQDIDEQGVRHTDGPYDPNLVLRYRSAGSGRILLLAGPDSPLTLAVFQPDGSVRRQEVEPGAVLTEEVGGRRFELVVADYYPRGRWISRPVIVPLEQRRPNQGRHPSAIRLTLEGRGKYSGWRTSRWCLFSPYPELAAAPELVAWQPRVEKITMPDGAEYEWLYSRVRHDLGATLIPGRLSVKFFPGRQRVESWRSDFWVRGPDEPTARPAAVYTNQTCSIGEWTLFQSGAEGRDHWRWTILGVGNRHGMFAMVLGSLLVGLGCLYAFYVKPVLRRRMRAAGARRSGGADRSAAEAGDLVEGPVEAEATGDFPELEPVPAEGVFSPGGNGQNATRVGVPSTRRSAALVLLFALGIAGGSRAAEPFAASRQAVALDRQVDWSRAGLIVVQDAGRYKTLDSFARENVAALYGREHLPGLSPLASVFDLLLRPEAYRDVPLVRIRDRGLRIHLSEPLDEAARQRIRSTGYMTPRELRDRGVQARLRELEPRFEMGRAVGRIRDAEATAFFLDRMLRIVPQPGASADAPWYTPDELRPNALLAVPEGERPSQDQIERDFGPPVRGVEPSQAVSVVGPWLELQAAWRSGDAAVVQQSLDRLAQVLPALASPGVYPTVSQRRAELQYYENFTSASVFSRASLGHLLYFIGALFGVAALVTRWRSPWRVGVVLLVLGLAWHAYGLGLRWYILGRIPVANMFEAIVASAWVGIAVALLVELIYQTRVTLLAAHLLGFFSLVTGSFVLPWMGSSGPELTTVMGILDNIMLRIHTVMIIVSYALIFLAAVIAVVYLVGYYRHAWRRRRGEVVAAAAAEGPSRAPLLAGALPGDDSAHLGLPAWLRYTDWSHLIMLNMAFVLLFVGGIVLGAAWADYSWGRPWGWDPKETFALNTWLIYAVLIHARFVVRRKGLWTAWLSILGCAMMLFNWFVVNFYIVGLHSYA